MTFLILPLMVVFELIKRVIAIPIYPIAYICRKWPRTNKTGLGWVLWAVLDDSIVVDSINRGYGPLEYCGYGKRAPLGFITEKLPKGRFTEFLRAFSWGALRNNAINLMVLTEQWIGNKTETISRKEWGKSFYEVRKFSGGLKLPYLEVWLFSGFRIQCGFISCGRFQVQARTYP